MSDTTHGFSLIELIVVTAIMLLLLGGGIAAYINFDQRQQVVATAKKIQQLFRSGQTLARVGEKPDGCNKLLAYRVYSRSNNGYQVVVEADCDADDVEYKTYQLPSNIELESSFDMRFLVLHGGVESAGSVTVVGVADGLRYQFEVTRGGEITNGDFIE